MDVHLKHGGVVNQQLRLVCVCPKDGPGLDLEVSGTDAVVSTAFGVNYLQNEYRYSLLCLYRYSSLCLYRYSPLCLDRYSPLYLNRYSPLSVQVFPILSVQVFPIIYMLNIVHPHCNSVRMAGLGRAALAAAVDPVDPALISCVGIKTGQSSVHWTHHHETNGF